MTAVVHILNRAPTYIVPQMTPYEAYFSRKPSVSHLRVFGCDAYAHVPKTKRAKFDTKTRKLIHVGYDSISTSYRLYDPVTRTIEHSREVVFDESSVLSSASSLPHESVSAHLPIDPDESLDDPVCRYSCG